MWEKAAGDVQAQRKLGASEMVFAQHAWPVLSAEDALFLDVDGTLLEFAARPMRFPFRRGFVRILKAIETKLDGALALISGREIDDLDRLFAPLRLPAAGVHGAEIRLSATASAHAFGKRLPEALIEAIAERAHDFPGVLIERKDFTIAVHYAQARGCKDALRAMIEEEMERQPMEGAGSSKPISPSRSNALPTTRAPPSRRSSKRRRFWAGSRFSLAMKLQTNTGFPRSSALRDRRFLSQSRAAMRHNCLPIPRKCGLGLPRASIRRPRNGDSA